MYDEFSEHQRSVTWDTHRWHTVSFGCIYCAYLSVLLILIFEDFSVVARGANPKGASEMNAYLTILMLLNAFVCTSSLSVTLWITWPRRTACEFHRRLCTGTLEQIELKRLPRGIVDRVANRSTLELCQLVLVEDARSLVDVLIGRLRFRVVRLPFEFTAIRGKVLHPVSGTLFSMARRRAATRFQIWEFSDAGWS